jgi:hypothetical protein
MNEKGSHNHRDWMIIIGCAITSIFLGVLGFFQYFKGQGVEIFFGSIFYLTIQLFTLESGSITGNVPLALNLARFLAPATVAGAGVKVLLSVFRDIFIGLQLNWYQNHVIVCGLGTKGLNYVKDFLEENKREPNDRKRPERKSKIRVVAIERNAECDGIVTARALGAVVLVGDARVGKILQNAGAERAVHIIAITGDDFANMAICQQAREISESRATKHQKKELKCHVHLNNPQVLEAAKLHERLWDKSETFAPYIFSIYRHAAKLAFERKPLDWKPITKDSPYAVHLIIFGFGRMGENILLQAARIGHFANRKRLQVTIVDRMADKKYEAFTFRYPNMEKICDVTPLTSDVEALLVLQRVKEISADPNTLASAVVCFNSDERSLTFGVSLAENLHDINFPISICMPQQSLLCHALEPSDRTNQNATSWLGGFGSCEDSCTAKRLIGKEEDAIACNIHELYKCRESIKPDIDKVALFKKPEMQEWHLLREDFRESNLQQADHMPIKLRAVGFTYRLYEDGETPDDTAFNISQEDLEALAIMEHNRWNAERWLAGWRLGPKDKLRRISDCLVEWEDLPDDIKVYDYNAIKDIPIHVKVHCCPAIS